MNTDPTQDAHSLGIALRLAQAQNRELRKQLAETQSQQWQPIETAPKDGTAFLAVSQEHIKSDWLPDMVEWADGGWVYTDNYNEYLFTLSHWMPMPSLPLPAPPMSDK